LGGEGPTPLCYYGSGAGRLWKSPGEGPKPLGPRFYSAAPGYYAAPGPYATLQLSNVVSPREHLVRLEVLQSHGLYQFLGYYLVDGGKNLALPNHFPLGTAIKADRYMRDFVPGTQWVYQSTDTFTLRGAGQYLLEDGQYVESWKK
jgi:hypothetical protein